MTSRQAHSAGADPLLASRRMARRLLSGIGSATLTAYQHDPTGRSTFVAHALGDDGTVYVAACPPPTSALARGALLDEETHVRLDVRLDCADATVRMTVASLHALGTLTWCEPWETPAILADARSAACQCAIVGDNPIDILMEICSQPGGLLGVVDLSRIIVHDAHGTSLHSLEDVALIATPMQPPVGQDASRSQTITPMGESATLSGPAPQEADAVQDAEILSRPGLMATGDIPAVAGSASSQLILWDSLTTMSALETVRGLGATTLHALCDGVRQGSVPGTVCSSRSSAGVTPMLWGTVICVDATPSGLMLMHIDEERVETISVMCPYTCHSIDALETYLLSATAG